MGDKASRAPQFIAAISVCMGSAAAGATLGWLSNTQSDLEIQRLNGVRVHPPEMMGLIGSFHLLGALCMCVPIGLFCDWFGRKMSMMMMIVPFAIGWLLILFAQHVGMIIMGRLVTGLSMGAFCVAAPMYTSEIAEPAIRGTLGTFFQLFLTVGCLFSQGAGLFDIRYCTAACMLPPIVFIILIFFQPETPRFNLLKGKEDAAKKALQKLRGKGYNVDPEIADIKRALQDEASKKVALKDALKSKAVKRSIVIVFGSQFCQQLSGVNAVFAFTTSIFIDAGFQSFDPKLATLIFGVFNVLSTIASTFLVEKGGRKFLMLISSFFGGISIVILAIMMTMKNYIEKETFEKFGFIAVIAVIAYVCMFAVGLGPVPWLLASEVFPPDVKGVLSSGAGTLSWGLGFLMANVYDSLKQILGADVPLYFFALCCFLSVVFEWFFIFETKGKTLDEIQQILAE